MKLRLLLLPMQIRKKMPEQRKGIHADLESHVPCDDCRPCWEDVIKAWKWWGGVVVSVLSS